MLLYTQLNILLTEETKAFLPFLRNSISKKQCVLYTSFQEYSMRAPPSFHVSSQACNTVQA